MLVHFVSDQIADNYGDQAEACRHANGTPIKVLHKKEEVRFTPDAFPDLFDTKFRRVGR